MTPCVRTILLGLTSALLFAGRVMAVAEDDAAPPLWMPEQTPQAPLIHAQADLPEDAGIPASQVELIQERYPDGRIKIERHVVLDAEMNYVNHGAFTMYDPQGQKVRWGQYRNGLQHGKWTSYVVALDGDPVAREAAQQFGRPLVSEAEFVDGKLHGVWTLADTKGRRVARWEFQNGLLHGTATWWYPNGEKRSEASYRNGVPDGDYLVWSADGKLAVKAQFVAGRLLVKKTDWYAPGKKRYEGSYLLGRAMEPRFDWWTSTVGAALGDPAGPDQKHGLWTFWYPNGQKQMEGTYREDLPDGEFQWWYANGQPQAKGRYESGVKTGTWVSWHPNGVKESQGEFAHGVLAGKWMHWSQSGKLAEIRDFSTELDPVPSQQAVEGAGPMSEEARAGRPAPATRQ